MKPTYQLHEILIFSSEIQELSFWKQMKVLFKLEKKLYKKVDRKIIKVEINDKLDKLIK